MKNAQGEGGGPDKKLKQPVTRKLVGVRIEPRLAKVLKGVAELYDCAVGELIEQVFIASMNGENFFAEDGRLSPETRAQLDGLKKVYGVDYENGYLKEAPDPERA